jgi:RNA polymerase sigma factor (sigma-70 family)
MKDNHFVKKQRTKEIKSTNTYWSYQQKVEGNTEALRANPDSLPEAHSGPTEAQLLMGEAINHLQGRQREIYLLVFREGKSNTEVGEILGISRDTVQVYKERAVKFLTAYCKGVLSNDK